MIYVVASSGLFVYALCWCVARHFFGRRGATGTILPRHADLGCDLYLVAWGALGEYLADDPLRTARAVDGCVSISVMPSPRPIVWSRWVELRQWRPTSNHRLYRRQFVRSADPSYQLQPFPCHPYNVETAAPASVAGSRPIADQSSLPKFWASRLAAIRRGLAAVRFKPSDLADVAETRVSPRLYFRFVGALPEEWDPYHPRLKTFVRSPMRFAGATSQHDYSDLDSV
jgi:hypothetical protein